MDTSETSAPESPCPLLLGLASCLQAFPSHRLLLCVSRGSALLYGDGWGVHGEDLSWWPGPAPMNRLLY